MSGKRDFEYWLKTAKKYDAALCKKYITALNILDYFFKRKGYGITFLFEENQIQISDLLSVFENNDELRKQDEKKNGVYSTALSLLIEYVKGKESPSEISDDISKAEDIPELPKESGVSATGNKRTLAKTPKEKLIRRIEREFKKCRYIGDIVINDEEYGLLKALFRERYDILVKSYSHTFIDQIFAVALVQIGARFYNGSYWPHVQKELGIEKMPANHQAWIGKSFFDTLTKFNKYRVDENQFVNNILLHCFITKYYAEDFFDFVFAFYKIDLKRDLNNYDVNKRKDLMKAMAKGESSKRAYKIKRHTADAVSANEKGSKIRIGRILRFMDNALFYDQYPYKSLNRVSQLFCAWASQSDAFDIEKKSVSGINRKGEKRFSSPYLHFDIKKTEFNVILPQQYIHLEEDEEKPEVFWSIKTDDYVNIIAAQTVDGVTGCNTIESKYNLPASKLFSDISVELQKISGERIKRFRIKSDIIRFFDKDWDNFCSDSYEKHLPVGQVYAFTEPDGVISSASDSVVGIEWQLGYNLYDLMLKKGDVLRLPNGKAKPVGRPLEEGILSQPLVFGSYIEKEGEKISIYKQVPLIYLRMVPSQENGTLIVINGKRHRFDIEKCFNFDIEEKTDERGYILHLDDYIHDDGVYQIIVDIPNSKKQRDYTFFLINGFSYSFTDAPYIFVKHGSIILNSLSDNAFTLDDKNELRNRFDFDILPDQDELQLWYIAKNEKYQLHIEIPVLKWQFDEREWNISQPEEIWHEEFPKYIYIKYPTEDLLFSMTPIMQDIEESESDESFSAQFKKDNSTGVFQCDTRKMISWFGTEEAKRKLFLDIGEQRLVFATVITRCFLNKNPDIGADFDKGELIIKSEISGFSNCCIDVFFKDECLAEKQPVTCSGVKLKVPIHSGEYRIDYYEYEDDDEDDFGYIDYYKFDTKTVQYKNPYDLTGRNITVKSITKKKDNKSVFFTEHYVLKEPIIISALVCDKDDPNYCFGNISTDQMMVRVRLRVIDQKTKRAEIAYDEGKYGYMDFSFDKELRVLVREDDEEDGSEDRYIFIDSEEYSYDIEVI